jgi:hypothetical protein
MEVDIGAHMRNSDIVNKSRGHVLLYVACEVVASCTCHVQLATISFLLGT